MEFVEGVGRLASVENQILSSPIIVERCPIHFPCPSVQKPLIYLGDTSPFFPGILLSRKPSEPSRKQLVFEKNDG